MPFKVIDLLKIIQIQKDQRAARMLIFQKHLCPALKAAPVVKSCQPVALRLCPRCPQLILHPVDAVGFLHIPLLKLKNHIH